MKDLRFFKFATVGSVLGLTTVLAALDCQARQSNVYSISGGYIFITGPSINSYMVEREWGIGTSTNQEGLRQFALRQWGGGEEYDARHKLVSGRKVYTEVAFASHSFNIKLPLVYVAIVMGVALFLVVWTFVAGAMWLINRRRKPSEAETT
jgi:hypothetical protein